MSFINRVLSFIKKLSLLILLVSIIIPLRYGSTNPKYLRLRCLHSLLSLTYSVISDSDRPTLTADYRAFETLLRLKPLVEFDPLSDPISVIKELRSSLTLSVVVPKPATCQVNKQVFNHQGHTVDAFWINHHQKSEEINTKNVLLYFHGGAYMAGDIHSYSGFECHLSRLLNLSVLHLEYRLVPEHPLPAAVDDAVALYNALLNDKISPSQMIIMGDSAGGGLSLLTIQSIISNGLPVPRAVVVLSPWTDLSSSGQSYVRNRLTDAIIRHEALTWGVKHVLGDHHDKKGRDDPMFSPLFGSFKGFPSMYVTVGTAELLEDDSRQLLDRAKQAEVDVTFEEGLHLTHVYPLFFPYYQEARNTLNNITNWINSKYDQ